MRDTTPLISVIVVTKEVNEYFVSHCLPALQDQTYRQFELIIVSNKRTQGVRLPSFSKLIRSKTTSPARMRDEAAGFAHGDILVFLDDDAYPHPMWLQNIHKQMTLSDTVCVCGPGLTPAKSPVLEQISGLFWESWLGSGAAGLYRSLRQHDRYVDDYPSFNFAIKKGIFDLIGGFDSDFWPGEDTKLCYEIVYRLKKKIRYSSDCHVYHRRRPIFKRHLEQIGRYGRQRGRFVWLYPETSLKPGYFMPTALAANALFIPVVLLQNGKSLQTLKILMVCCLVAYLAIVLIESVRQFVKGKSLPKAALFFPATVLSHMWYGICFVRGLLVGFKDKCTFSRLV